MKSLKSKINFSKIFLVTAIVTFLSACGTVPENRNHYMSLVKDMSNGYVKAFGYRDTFIIDMPFDKAVANLRQQFAKCIPDGGVINHARPGRGITAVNNRSSVNIVSKDKAEATIQTHHSDMIMQSKGGIYIMAMDLYREGSAKTRIDAVGMKAYINPITKWPLGHKSCFGIGRNK